MELTRQIYTMSSFLCVLSMTTSVFAASTQVSSSSSFTSSDVDSQLEPDITTESDSSQTESRTVPTNTFDTTSTTTAGGSRDCSCDIVQTALTEVRATKESCRDAIFLVDAHSQKVRSLQQEIENLAAIVRQMQGEKLTNNNPIIHEVTTSRETSRQPTPFQDDVRGDEEREEEEENRNTNLVQVEVPSSLRGVTFVKMEEPDVLPRDCKEVQMRISNITGVYTISPDGCGQPFQVYCDMYTSGGGWTVFQRRQDGSLSFDQTWGSYRRGFGNLLSEFWLGLDRMNRLTIQDEYELRIDLLDFNGSKANAVYDRFRINDYWANFRLTIGEFKGNGSAGDSLSYHNSMPFSTADRDNDLSTANCAEMYPGGWWHNKCLYSNLNGHYLSPDADEFAQGVIWYKFGGFYTSLKFSEMKIRPI